MGKLVLLPQSNLVFEKRVLQVEEGSSAFP